MEYFVCEAKSAAALRDEVNLYLHKGWKVTGGVAVVQSLNSGSFWYHQAIVHDSPNSSHENEPELA
jgi:hypothetical protein